MLHKILLGISIIAGFTAYAGLAGCVDLDTVTVEALVSAAVLFVICGITGYLAYVESGRRRKKNRPR